MKAFANVISSAAMSVALASSALGANMYPKMYDASYVYKSPAGVCNIRMISDGNGWLFKQDGNEAEMWLEKSGDFIVLSKSTAQDMTIEMELTSSSTATPAPELFALPSNYRIVSQ